MNRIQNTLTQMFGLNVEEEVDLIGEEYEGNDESDELSEDQLNHVIGTLTQDLNGDDEIVVDDDNDDQSVILIESTRIAEIPEPELKRIKSTDSSTIRYFNSIDGVRRIFKKGESFTSKKPESSKFVYKICSFFDKELKAYAECEKYIKRTDTNLMLFINHDKFQKHPAMEYLMLANKVNILLSDLNLKVASPESILKYDEKKKLSASHGVDISYEFTKPLTKFTPKYEDYDIRPTVLDLFAGCGGMSQGFINAGFKVKWAVEKANDAVSTLEKNHHDTEVFPEDIRIFEERLARKDKAYENITPNHIHFSPPCQGFSKLNRYDGPENLEKNNLTLTALKIVEHLMPDTVSMENVTGMLDDNKGCLYFLREVISTLVVLGYSTRLQILSCERYGDATLRKRVIVTAARSPLPIPCYPKETHAYSSSIRSSTTCRDKLKPIVTPGSVLKDLIDVEPSNSYKIFHEGKVIYNHCIAGTERSADAVTVDEHHPVAAIKKQANLKHFSHARGLTVREYMRLHSFPDDFIMRGSLTKQKDQIGNCVPIRLATEIAEAIGKSSYPCHQLSMPN